MLDRRRLPHLDVLGRLQFVTFCLHDSLPQNRTFPRSSLISGKAFVAMDRQLDEARSGPTFLRQQDIARIVLASIDYGAALGHYEMHS